MRALLTAGCMLAIAGCGRIAFDPASTIDDAGGSGDGGSRDGSIDALASGLQPFAYWKLDETSGSSAADSTGNGHPLTLVNAPAWTAGKFGGAVTTAGTNDYLTAPLLDLSGTNAVTVAMWVRRNYTAGPLHTLFEFSPDFNANAAAFGLFPDDQTSCSDQIMMGVNGDVGRSMACYTQPTSGEWHHLVAVYDKSQVGVGETMLYIDNIAQTRIPSVETFDNGDAFGAQPFFLASRGGTQEFNVTTFDDVLIFDRALTPAEIATL